MNVLITGANGFIGSNLCEYWKDDPDIKIVKGTRKDLDLHDLKSTTDFLNDNKIDGVIHCAIEGGRRTKPDTSEMFYNNLLMFENLLHSLDFGKPFINIASGAEFDRRYPIVQRADFDIFRSVPVDYYGLAKSIISKRILTYRKGVNVRLFGCFNHNEGSERFIRSNLERYICREPMLIHQDKYMDFFYMGDLQVLLRHLILKGQKYEYNWCEHDLNATYNQSKKLSDIANFINTLGNYKVDIHIGEQSENSYTGTSYGMSIEMAVNKFKGLEEGIKECYERLKNNLLH